MERNIYTQLERELMDLINTQNKTIDQYILKNAKLEADIAVLRSKMADRNAVDATLRYANLVRSRRSGIQEPPSSPISTGMR
tara:strand:- start:362 stop:607 length:246 start_codon:yes stop_codon:yes gene_type:complete